MDNTAIAKIWRKIFNFLEAEKKINIEVVNKWRLNIYEAQENCLTSIFDKVMKTFMTMDKKYEKER